MKKIIAILITLTVSFSTLSIMPAFAYETVDNVTWAQNFDNTNDGGTWDKAVDASYASGGRYGFAGGDAIEGGIVTKDSSSCLKLAPTKTGSNTRGGKVFIDQSAFEAGKTYVIEMDAYLEGHSSNNMSFNVKWLNGTGSTEVDSKANTLENGQPVKISSNPLCMTQELLNTDGGINLRIDSTEWSFADVNNRTVVYIDNVKVIAKEKVSYFKDKIDEDGATFNFNDIADTATWTKNTDYTTNGTSCAITNEKDANGNGKSLYFVPKSNDIISSRLVLKDLFKNEDLGKSYNVSLKIYIDTTTDISNPPSLINIGAKAYDQANNAWGYDTKKYTIGAEGDIVPNTWSTVKFVTKVDDPINGQTYYLTDGIGFSYRKPSNITTSEVADATGALAPFYIDDIVITPKDDFDYFADENGNKIATDFDAGYYAESENAEEKVGEVVVNSYISVDEKATEKYEKFGMYVYISADDKKDVFACSEAIDSLVAAQGYINVLITEIAEKYFDTSIVAVPYVVVGENNTVLGEPFTFKVNDKENLTYLGVKSSNSGGQAPAEPEPSFAE